MSLESLSCFVCRGILCLWIFKLWIVWILIELYVGLRSSTCALSNLVLVDSVSRCLRLKSYVVQMTGARVMYYVIYEMKFCGV